jgi:nicotinate-nucleotide adenylyltransferase
VALTVSGRANWQSSDIELLISGPSFTTDTIRLFHDQGYHASELFFIIGADAFAEIATWKDYPNLLERAHFAVVSRPGYPANELPARLPLLTDRMLSGPFDEPFESAPVEAWQGRPMIILIDAPTPDVSATAIRQRCAGGATIAGMVDARVQQHIDQHGLYTSIGPGRWADDHADTPAAGRLHGQS